MDYSRAISITTAQDAQEARWKAERDAETLAEALVIQDDPERVRNAKSAAAGIAKRRREHEQEWLKEISNLERLAKSSNSKRIVIPKGKSYGDFPTEITTPQRFVRDVE